MSVAISLGNLVWLDSNANGIQDGGEVGLGGVTVRLISGGADGNIATTADNQTLGSIQTAADGTYYFTTAPISSSSPLNQLVLPINQQVVVTQIINGVPRRVPVNQQYQIEFSLPADYVFTNPNAGADNVDSDASLGTGRTPTFTITTTDTNFSINSSDGRIFNYTLDAGLYQLASIGDRVWLDSNANGIQDGGESGLAGITVNLLDGNGNTVTTATTDANGNYGFSGLNPGQYQVQFVAPTGYVFSNPDAGADGVDSDANIATGITQTVTLTSGENNLTLDAGLYQLASIGDRVWLDSNANGIQDGGESGLAGITVNLLDGNGNTVTTATTDANGNYGFSG
ncbi:MAG: SdrD B-like domain-containing protein, partial [Pseudanabaenaceae cyanobacterium]